MSPDGAAATCVATLAGHSSSVWSVAFDKTGRFVATGSNDNTAKIWEITSDGAAATCVATLAGHSKHVRSVAFDPTGRFVATGSEDKTAKLWKILEQQQREWDPETLVSLSSFGINSKEKNDIKKALIDMLNEATVNMQQQQQQQTQSQPQQQS
jgi:WD40 repeat protein